jgi:superfamily I DNA/RNA helicase
MSQKQSFQKHARWFPPFHFVASPITGLYAASAFVAGLKEPSTATLIHAVWAFGIFGGVIASRIMALTVQNRVIRLEMRLRLKELLSGEALQRSRALSVRQLIALRFASDAELPALVERTVKGEFAKPRDIKAAITDWQADWLRA